jgi:hypothetical protein
VLNSGWRIGILTWFRVNSGWRIRIPSWIHAKFRLEDPDSDMDPCTLRVGGSGSDVDTCYIFLGGSGSRFGRHIRNQKRQNGLLKGKVVIYEGLIINIYRTISIVGNILFINLGSKSETGVGKSLDQMNSNAKTF